MIAIETIALSGALAGVLDISATAMLVKTQGMPTQRLLQFVASGAFGASAFEGGKRTASLGLTIHFLIAVVVAAVYYAFSLGLPIVLERPVLCGCLYGIVVHLVMSRIVVPLSRASKRPFSIKAFLTQLVIHVFCVGLPIALVQNHLSQ
jgi:uncharacterized membrane protein YagU involved in acid resistance